MKRTASARKDIETARNACDKFRLIPVTIMNFLEGTRFTTAKREKENSPFAHLLKPKPGGMAVVLCTLGQRLHSILDVTIVYPEGIPGLWTFLCSNSMEIKVRVKQIPVTPELLEIILQTGDSANGSRIGWISSGMKRQTHRNTAPPACPQVQW